MGRSSPVRFGRFNPVVGRLVGQLVHRWCLLLARCNSVELLLVLLVCCWVLLLLLLLLLLLWLMVIICVKCPCRPVAAMEIPECDREFE